MSTLTDEALARLLDEAASAHDVPVHGPDEILAALAEQRTRLPLLRRRWVQLSAAAVVLTFVAGMTVVSRGSDQAQMTAGQIDRAQDSFAKVPAGAGERLAAPAPAPVYGSIPDSISGGSTIAGSGAGSSGGTAASVPAPAAAAPGAAVGAPTADEGAARVVKAGELSLVVKDKQVSAVLTAVEKAAKAQGGYISSGTADEYGDNPSGELTIRVPVDRFEDLVAAVRALDVKVRTASTSGKDVTAAYSDLEAQLRTLRAARERFLLLLSKAKNDRRDPHRPAAGRRRQRSHRPHRGPAQAARQPERPVDPHGVGQRGRRSRGARDRAALRVVASAARRQGRLRHRRRGPHPPQRAGAARAARPRRRCRRASPGLAGGAAPARVGAAPLGSCHVGRRIGVMGGTFDPIHHGHLSAANEVADLFALDEVVFVPTGQPWQKAEREVSAAEDRYLMTVVATASNPVFSVSRTDIDRPGATYTFDTLVALREQYGDESELFFITGADALAQILGWVKADELFALAHFVGVSRPGYEPVDVSAFPEGAVTLVDIPALAISSSDCRDRVRAGKPVWYLVPDGVVQYISKRRLYR